MCGVVGIIGAQDAAKEVFMALFTLQHRGQDGAGILSFDDQDEDNGGFHIWKNTGLIANVFDEQRIESLKGSMALGHTRYSTVGGKIDDKTNVQPFVANYPYGIGMAHNGNVVNYFDLTKRIEKENRRTALTSSDLETIQNLFSETLAEVVPDQESMHEVKFADIKKAAKHVFDKAVGAYSVVSIIADQGMVAFRDPNGIRPLILGRKTTFDGKTAYCVASESISLNFLGYQIERDLKPGEVIYIDKNSKLHSEVVDGKKATPCMFEWVYFAGAESVVENKAVYGARLNLGRGLGKAVRKQMDAGEMSPDVVIPVPETARIAAISLAEEIGVPYRELLIKNRYIHRSFILDTQDKRAKAVDLKLNPVQTEIKGKNVLLVDDSIVRGTTSTRLIELARRAGAKEVYFASTCSPIRHPCYYGVDFPDPDELLATNRTEAEIAEKLGADKVIYLSKEGVKDAIGVPEVCMACLDEQYPTDVSAGVSFRHKRKKQK